MGVATSEADVSNSFKPVETVKPDRPTTAAFRLLHKKHENKSLQLTDFQYQYREHCEECKVKPLKVVEDLVAEHISYGSAPMPLVSQMST